MKKFILKKTVIAVTTVLTLFAFSTCDNLACSLYLTRPAFAQTKFFVLNDSFQLLPLQLKVQDFTDSDERGVLLQSRWTDIKFNEDDKKYSSLVAALSKYNQEKREAFDKQRKRVLDSAKQHRSAITRKDVTFTPYRLAYNLYARRADSQVVSIFDDSEIYMGDGFKFIFLMGKNYNSRTGKPIKLGEIFTDKDMLTEVIQKQLLNKYPDVDFAKNDSIDMKKVVEYLVKNETVAWTMDYQGVTFYFNPHHISQFDEEMLTTTVLFSRHPELFITK